MRGNKLGKRILSFLVAMVILLAADGLNNMQISTQVGLGQDSVS